MPISSVGMTRERIVGDAFLSLWQHLGGPEIRGRRARAFWRNGTRDSVALDIEQGLWNDHATREGGDAVDLVRAVMGLSVAEALAWLEREGYRTPARRMTPSEIAEQRRRQKEAARHRLAVADFRRILDRELDAAKLAAADAGDDEALERAASLQFRLAQAPGEVMSEMLAEDGARVQWLIEQGRADLQHAAKVTRLAVDMLASAEAKAVPNAA